MPFCPECRDEFQDWVEVCPDCGVRLVATLPEPPPRPKRETSSEPLVTIATYNYPLEAHLARTKLESEGIEGFVADEHTINANWLYSIAVGGVKLWVKESDAGKAAQVLQDTTPDISEETKESIEYTDDERCPRCNSIDIHYETFHIRRVFFLWFLIYLVSFPFIFPFMKRKWKCNACGYEWKMAKNREKTDQNIYD
jgi:hypothetical protein